VPHIRDNLAYPMKCHDVTISQAMHMVFMPHQVLKIIKNCLNFKTFKSKK